MKAILTTSLFMLNFLAASVGQTVLTYEEFMKKVNRDHPLSQVARLSQDEGQAYLRSARGYFDPKLYGDIRQKYFDGSNYYNLPQAGLKIPTWFGLELETGYTAYTGDFLNPENNNPEDGLYHLGLSIPLGKGLFVDQRRTELRKAQKYVEMTKAEQDLLMNKLLYEAGIAYWSWFKSYHVISVYENALELAQIRFEAVRQSVAFGDRSAIDTLEAGIQVQNRMLSLQQARIEQVNSAQKLSVFLWEDGLIPLELEENTLPQELEALSSLDIYKEGLNDIDSFLLAHPKLNYERLDIERNEIERRWKSEQLKPNVDLKYNALNNGANSYLSFDPNLNNYQWGLQISMPIFLRKERGEVRLADLKIRESKLKLQTEQLSLRREIQSAMYALDVSRQQMALSELNVRDLSGLLQGERSLFDSGESSLFMVNSREVAYIAAQINLLQYNYELMAATLRLEYASGQLSGQFNEVN